MRLCHTIYQSLRQGRSLVLASIMTHSGSAPRTAGARMLVLPRGSIRGSVGGGRYEAEAIEAAMELMACQGGDQGPEQAYPARVLHFSLKGATDMDMICGGELNLLLELIIPDDESLLVFGAASRAEEEGRAFVLADILGFNDETIKTLFAGPGRREARGTVRRALYLPGGADGQGDFVGEAARTNGAQPGLERDLFRYAGKELHSRLMSTEAGPVLLQPFPAVERVHIFGAGHVSQALARSLEHTGFRSIVLDDRAGFVTPERFPRSRLEVLPSLTGTDVAAYLQGCVIDEHDAMVIVTRGHSHDRDVLAETLHTRAGYIGMIGSRAKTRQVFNSLIGAGFAPPDLERVHAPIGLEIGAETPEEIAVSITAELIRWRRMPGGSQRGQ